MLCFLSAYLVFSFTGILDLNSTRNTTSNWLYSPVDSCISKVLYIHPSICEIFITSWKSDVHAGDKTLDSAGSTAPSSLMVAPKSLQKTLTFVNTVASHSSLYKYPLVKKRP